MNEIEIDSESPELIELARLDALRDIACDDNRDPDEDEDDDPLN